MRPVVPSAARHERLLRRLPDGARLTVHLTARDSTGNRVVTERVITVRR